MKPKKCDFYIMENYLLPIKCQSEYLFEYEIVEKENWLPKEAKDIILYGFLFSSIIQSSSICISIIIPLIGIGVLSIQSCFYLIIGFNIGTVSSLFFTGLNTNLCSLILFIISFILLIIYIIRKNPSEMGLILLLLFHKCWQ